MKSTVKYLFLSSHLPYYAISEFFLKQSRISPYDSRVETAWWCNDYVNKIALQICHLKWKSLSHVQLSETLWTVARQVPLSMGFSRQEYWSRLPFPPSGYLPNPGIKPASPPLTGVFLYHWATWEAPILFNPSNVAVSIIYLFILFIIYCFFYRTLD